MRSLFAQRTMQEVFRCYLRLKEKQGVGQDTSPDPPGEGYATGSMRGSAYSPLSLWVSQHCALCTGKTVNSRKADSIPQIPGAL